MKKFTRIAMRATIGDWKSIKNNFSKNDVLGIDNNPSPEFPYLINYFDANDMFGIGHYNALGAEEVHETFNAKIFLDACGIKTDVYEITKEQVNSLLEHGGENTRLQLKSMFPNYFKNGFTGWAKDSLRGNEKWICYFENDVFKYGIGADGKWFESKNTWHNFKFSDNDHNTEATPQEVETALICEAKKRYKVGKILENHQGIWELEKFNIVYTDKYNNGIYNIQGGGKWLFMNGKWATIIETITIEEAEKLLNKKIV